MSVKVNIAQGLKRTRKAAGRSVDDVGSVLGLSGKTISAWEVGRGQPDGDQLIAICKYLGARLSDFYGDEYDDLTADEAVLVGNFRACSPKGMAQIMEYAEDTARRHPKSAPNDEGARTA